MIFSKSTVARVKPVTKAWLELLREVFRVKVGKLVKRASPNLESVVLDRLGKLFPANQLTHLHYTNFVASRRRCLLVNYSVALGVLRVGRQLRQPITWGYVRLEPIKNNIDWPSVFG